MPAPKRYLTSLDISEYIGISRTYARYMLNRCEMNGFTVDRKTNPHRITVRTFSKFLAFENGGDPKEHEETILEFLRERDSYEREAGS